MSQITVSIQISSFCVFTFDVCGSLYMVFTCNVLGSAAVYQGEKPGYFKRKHSFNECISGLGPHHILLNINAYGFDSGDNLIDTRPIR